MSVYLEPVLIERVVGLTTGAGILGIVSKFSILKIQKI